MEGDVLKAMTGLVVPPACPVSFCLDKIGGRWKPVILYLVRQGVNRYSRLYKRIPNVSKQMLTDQLRELEADGILNRKVYGEVPPRVEYTLTPYGFGLLPVIDAMSTWGSRNMAVKNHASVVGASSRITLKAS